MGPFAGLAIYINQASGNSVYGNDVYSSFLGLEINQSGGNTVQSNTFVHLEGFGMADGDSLGGNLFITNTVNEAPYGLYLVRTSTDTFTSNKFFNVNNLNYTP
jgi:parallel beta-helix repeat protein